MGLGIQMAPSPSSPGQTGDPPLLHHDVLVIVVDVDTEEYTYGVIATLHIELTVLLVRENREKGVRCKWSDGVSEEVRWEVE